MAAKVRILVDVHEQRSGLPALLEEFGAEVEVLSLSAGDYALGDDTLVERKAVLDLHSAVRNGHLWPQLAKLRTACAYPYLLVEGRDLDGGGRGLHPNAIRGACLAAIDQGVAMLRSDSREDSARWLYRSPSAASGRRRPPSCRRTSRARRRRPRRWRRRCWLRFRGSRR